MKMRAMEALNDREWWGLWQTGEYILCLQALKFKFLRNPVLGKLNTRFWATGYQSETAGSKCKGSQKPCSLDSPRGSQGQMPWPRLRL